MAWDNSRVAREKDPIKTTAKNSRPPFYIFLLREQVFFPFIPRAIFQSVAPCVSGQKAVAPWQRKSGGRPPPCHSKTGLSSPPHWLEIGGNSPSHWLETWRGGQVCWPARHYPWNACVRKIHFDNSSIYIYLQFTFIFLYSILINWKQAYKVVEVLKKVLGKYLVSDNFGEGSRKFSPMSGNIDLRWKH